MTPSKTPFAGFERLGPGDPLSADSFYFQNINPKLADRLGQLGAVTHRHDAHAAMANPTLAHTVTTPASGGSIPAGTPIYVTYTLIDADGGETLPRTPLSITTAAGFTAPVAPPTAVVSYAAGTLLAATYNYAITVTDGTGGETTLGPAIPVTVDPGHALAEVTISGLTALVAASSGGAGGAGWRLWRQQAGGPWYLMAVGPAATNTHVDAGASGDCSVTPPASGTTLGTNQLVVTVPGGQPAGVVSFNIYASLDGSFGSPALLGNYSAANLGVAQTYTSLVPGLGSPPPVSTCYPGANQIDPDTDILDWPWKLSVADVASLPAFGNSDGDARVTLDTHTIYVWNDGSSTWVAAGGGGGGGATATEINVEDNGVHIDGVYKTNGSMTAASDVLLGSGFTPGDVGKLIAVANALSTAPDKNTLVTTIASYTDSSHVHLALAADNTTGAGTHYVYGTDNTAALQALCGAAQGKPIAQGTGICMVSDMISVKQNIFHGAGPRTILLSTSTNPLIQMYGNPVAAQGGDSTTVRDLTLATVFNYSLYIGGSPPADPVNSYALLVRGGGTAANGVPLYVVERVATPKGAGLTTIQPYWSGVLASYSSGGKMVLQDSSFYAQMGPALECQSDGSGIYGIKLTNLSLAAQNATAAELLVTSSTHLEVAGITCQDGIGIGLVVTAGSHIRIHDSDFPKGAINGSTDLDIEGCEIDGTLTVAAGVSHFRIRGNDVNGAITVAAGGSNEYIIVHNDPHGHGVTDGGTGVNKVVANNLT